MNMPDDIESTVKFIELIRLNPCLYDQTRSDYSNRNKQDKVWGEIARQLNEPVAACRERWKNIRGRYVKQMNKPPSGSAAKTKKPYYLAEYLNFLDTFIRSRTPTGNMPSQSVEFDEVLSSDAIEHQSNSIPDLFDADEEASVQIQNPIYSDTSATSTPEPSAGSSSQLNYNRQKTKKTVTLSDVNRSAFNYFEKRQNLQNSTPTVIDADEAFLKSVLPDMKSMNEAQKRNFKIAVLRVAGEILNQPILTPPSINSVINETSQSPAPHSNQSVITPSSSSIRRASPSPTMTTLRSVSPNDILERPEQDGSQQCYWNGSIFLPLCSVSQTTDSLATNLNENIEFQYSTST